MHGERFLPDFWAKDLSAHGIGGEVCASTGVYPSTPNFCKEFWEALLDIHRPNRTTYISSTPYVLNYQRNCTSSPKLVEDSLIHQYIGQLSCKCPVFFWFFKGCGFTLYYNQLREATLDWISALQPCSSVKNINLAWTGVCRQVFTEPLQRAQFLDVANLRICSPTK